MFDWLISIRAPYSQASNAQCVLWQTFCTMAIESIPFRVEDFWLSRQSIGPKCRWQCFQWIEPGTSQILTTIGDPEETDSQLKYFLWSLMPLILAMLPTSAASRNDQLVPSTSLSILAFRRGNTAYLASSVHLHFLASWQNGLLSWSSMDWLWWIHEEHLLHITVPEVPSMGTWCFCSSNYFTDFFTRRNGSGIM